MFLALSLCVSVASGLILRSRHDSRAAVTPIADSLAAGDSPIRLNRIAKWSTNECVGASGSLTPRFVSDEGVRQPPAAGSSNSIFHGSGTQCRRYCYVQPYPWSQHGRFSGSEASGRRWHVYVSDEIYEEIDDPYAPQSSDDVEGTDAHTSAFDSDYDDPIGAEYEDGDVMPVEETEAEPASSSRFGTPRFMESTSRIFDAAKSKLSNLFSWSQDELKGGTSVANVEMEDLGPRQHHNTVNYSDADILRLPYVMSRDVNMALEKWPENCFLRIRLVSYYPYLLKIATKRLLQGIKEHTNLRVGNVKPMPMRKKRWCLLSSPHVDKRSKDLFEIQEHVRFLDVFPVAKQRSKEVASSEDGNNSESGTENSTTGEGHNEASATTPNADSRWRRVDTGLRPSVVDDQMKFKGLLMVPLPSMVSFDYWFEEVHKPVKNRSIDKVFRRRRIWVSKYFLYNHEKREKAELIDKLTSPELYKEIPLRWQKHPCDYFACQLGELRKLYNFVVERKAVDEARQRYGVKVPQLLDIDEVRFIPNEEDRRCGYISSDSDDEQDIARELAELENQSAKKKRR